MIDEMRLPRRLPFQRLLPDWRTYAEHMSAEPGGIITTHA